MRGKELIDKLTQEKDSFLILAPRTEYDKGCIGWNEEKQKLVYDYDLLFESLCNSWRGTFKTEEELREAVEDHLSYNTLRSLAYYKNSPQILVRDENDKKVTYGED